ncbi:MAG: DUF2721 domain-containing protein [Gammaproteobacteria bacterium]|jgi:cellulose synthase/poly-beta-1,6-N-acetylglucosamine synthase-like glycosyltransferase
MPENYTITAIANVIQLAVAPVFLLTGIGAILNVMTSRLSRIIDRDRVLKAQLPTEETAIELIETELAALSLRGKYINWSITFSTISALLVSAVVAILFLGAFVNFNVAVPVGFLFIIAMVVLIVALILFLKEIMLATTSIRIGRH